MGKVRIEAVPEFGKRSGKPVGLVVDANHDAVLASVQNKLQLKKKDVVTLCLVDVIGGRRALAPGDLSTVLYDGAKVYVCQGVVPQASPDDPPPQPKLSKKQKKAIDELRLVKVACGALSARGKPNLDTLAILQHCAGVTGVVTLLRHDECGGDAGRIGEACARLGLQWFHAPLAGPKAMGMIGADKPRLAAEDLDSFRQVRQIREVLQSSEQNFVVHCAAGLHRTGIFSYLLLRELEHSPEDALDIIQQMRQETYDEFLRLGFRAKADALFAIIGSGASSAEAVVEIMSERLASEEAEVEVVDGAEDGAEDPGDDDCSEGAA